MVSDMAKKRKKNQVSVPQNDVISSRDVYRISPHDVAELNGLKLLDPRVYPAKWLYVFMWDDLVKIGTTYRDRPQVIAVEIRAREVCKREGFSWPDSIYSTGGTTRHERALFDKLQRYAVPGSRDWYYRNRGFLRVMNPILRLHFNRHMKSDC